MNSIEKLVCDCAVEYLYSSWSLVDNPPSIEYKNEKIKQIQENLQDACWAIIELPYIVSNYTKPQFKKTHPEPKLSFVKNIKGVNVLFYRNHFMEDWKVKKAEKREKVITYWV